MKRRMMFAAVFCGLCASLSAVDTKAVLEKAAANENRRCAIIQADPLGKRKADKTGIQRADKICDGIILFSNVGTTEEIRVGKRNIDWRGGQRNHQEFVAQLSRFFMLGTLQGAWIATGDDKYPDRARELMEDYMDAIAKEPDTFVDYQFGGNLLNASLRLDSWGRALLAFRNCKAFDAAFVERVLKEYSRLANMIRIKTKPGMSNWQIAQASSLLTASIRFEGLLPDAPEWRKHGSEVISECFRRQFRPDGVHCENSIGYHGWMLAELTTFYNLKKGWPVPELQIPEQVFRGALDFYVVASRFRNNDIQQVKSFPKVGSAVKDGEKRAKKAGFKDYKAPVARVFENAALVYGGNEKEQFLFDAAPFPGFHTHWNRLLFEYVLDGYAVIPDLGTTTYDRKADPEGYWVGRSTTTHATLNFSGLDQMAKDAKLLEHKVAPDFATALGEFNEGYAKFFPKGKELKKVLNAQFRRRVTWLPGEYMLVFDRTSTPAPDQETRAVWPVLPVDSFKAEGLRFTGINAQMPSILIEMIAPAPKTVLTVVSGEEKAKRPGWKTVHGKGLQTAPELTFAAPATANPVTAVTLIAARSAGQPLPAYKVESSAPGKLVIALPQGGRDEYTWKEDLTGFQLKRTDASGKVTQTF